MSITENTYHIYELKRFDFSSFKVVLTIFCILFFLDSYAQQDVWLQSHAAPISNCGLTNSEPVNVSIYNNSASSMGFNSITASYSIDGGPIVNQLIGSTISGFATINFTFSVNANLSTCGSHIVKVWVARAGDPNQTNDTLAWTVNNDCLITPGTITPNPIVCAGLNSGTLNLIGQNNGTLSHWEMSNDGGTIWSNIINNTPTFNYTNIPQTRQYRVFIDGGICPDAYSAIATLTANPQPVPGIIDGADSLCVTSASGSVYLTGTSNPVVQWESSLDDGSTWSAISNTTYTNNFTNLLSTTLFRALIGGGTCPDTYSDTAEIFIDVISGPGIISGSDSLCITNGNGILNLSGPIGNTLFWQSSINNGLTWSTIANTTTSLNYSSLSETTLFRAYTEGANCPSIFSDTAEIYIQPTPVSPDLIGGDSLCVTNVNGVINLPTPPSAILGWEFSIDNGVTWTSTGNTTDTESFSGLMQTTLYRVLLDGLYCPSYFSNPETVFIENETFPGIISGSDSLCITSANGTLSVSGIIGNVNFWEYSNDSGATWINITNTTTTETYNSLDTTTWYRTFTNGGFCPSYYSDTAIIFIEDTIVAGNIFGGGTFCDNANGVLTLVNSTGSIDRWENSSDNGNTWNIINNQTLTEPFTGITTDQLYRVYIDSKVCLGGYSSSASINLDQLSEAGVINSDTSICIGDNIVYTLTGFLGDSIRWENSLNGSLWGTNLNASNDSNIITNALQPEYQMVIVSNGVCPADTTNISYLTVNPLPNVFVSNDTTIFIGESANLQGSGGQLGLWTPNININDNTSLTPTVTPTSDIYYIYSVIDNNGCINSDSVFVKVLPALKIDIKNIVTLNNDGFNDTWIIEGIENFPNTSVKLFNTYGKEIYANGNYSNEWDGTYNGKKLPNGTYFYVVKMSISEQEFKGNITLLGNE